MSIKITPHGYRADIIVDSMEEAREVLRELTPSAIGCFSPSIPASSGLASESTAATAAGDIPPVEDESPQVEDIDDTPRAPRRLKSWNQEEEDQVKIWIRKGMSVAEVAESLGRTPSSVRNKLLVLERERAACGLDPIRPKKVAA